jgi:HAD superfamily phosphoserine phosphatase-like hydrolase
MTESTAAFFRVEGTLLKRGTVAAAGYFAANGQGFRERATRLGHVAIAAAGFGLLGQNDRALANRMTWAALRGMSEDRLAVLAEEYVEEQAKPNLLDSGLELISRARRAGHRIILVSESLDRIVRPLAEHARRIDDVVSNSLEIVDGETTGRLVEPIVGGHEGGRWVRAYAEEHRIDLGRSVAYGCHGPDLLMLAAVGEACAVNPDYTLRRAATEARWPILDYAA